MRLVSPATVSLILALAAGCKTAGDSAALKEGEDPAAIAAAVQVGQAFVGPNSDVDGVIADDWVVYRKEPTVDFGFPTPAHYIALYDAAKAAGRDDVLKALAGAVESADPRGALAGQDQATPIKLSSKGAQGKAWLTLVKDGLNQFVYATSATPTPQKFCLRYIGGNLMGCVAGGPTVPIPGTDKVAKCNSSMSAANQLKIFGETNTLGGAVKIVTWTGPGCQSAPQNP